MEQVVAHLESLAGTHLEPAVVEAFLVLHSERSAPAPMWIG
jgi:hypothetical protein